MLNSARGRAYAQGLPFAIAVSDIVIPERCPVFGEFLKVGGGEWAPSLDRIIPELGYTPRNIIVISNRANRIKNNASLAELMQLVTFLKATMRQLYE